MSQVTLDIGSTFIDVLNVQHILEDQLRLHSLGNVQVLPDGFSFRIFQGKLKYMLDIITWAVIDSSSTGSFVLLFLRSDGSSEYRIYWK